MKIPSSGTEMARVRDDAMLTRRSFLILGGLMAGLVVLQQRHFCQLGNQRILRIDFIRFGGLIVESVVKHKII